ncbi:ABC transporter ATP-binding protein [Proteus myxofaciens]|uniref:ATP-binding component of an ABC superfamily nickel transporter n=1 Tax=Proteus myxofaciens ATCC 19692 TaxID=1354337 RepID=A0A198FZ66_9GAMM|nr:dipeptide/oligopeptide/nickel ABC transporter ATP-binding protein [Proteus myxofaciens]OAT30367.1 ATP-binding component of an ABC superfamily nickel transporter [Proteus myxofaciens ATCC 19692]
MINKENKLLQVNNISKSYAETKGTFFKKRKRIIESLSFYIQRGEAFGLVGESGSGKSTLARLICGLESTDSGDIYLNNLPVTQRIYRQGVISIVFQDYLTSVNPTFTVADIIAEPIRIMKQLCDKNQLEQHIVTLLNKVGLSDNVYHRYIHELSGGQAQRVCLCRALASQPQLIVLDEALSSLDIPTQVEILELLKSLKEELQLSYFFISHDIKTVTYFCDTVMFFSQGQKIELCDIKELANVKHDYAKKIIQSVI